MNIVCLNGNPVTDYFDDFVRKAMDMLVDKGHSISLYDLKSLNIPLCTGCFGCWVKNPGMCISNDPSREISRATMHSDILVFASPLIMGFPSAILKNINDKLIQNLHPYIEFDQKEMHHRRRYARYPKLGLLLALEQDTDSEDLDIVRNIYERFALNFKTTLKFVCTSTQSPIEVADEITSY